MCLLFVSSLGTNHAERESRSAHSVHRLARGAAENACSGARPQTAFAAAAAAAFHFAKLKTLFADDADAMSDLK
jgi:hypothetical protein